MDSSDQPRSATKGFAWYIKRLSVMDPGEIFSRIWERFVIYSLKLEHRGLWAKSDTYSSEDMTKHKFCQGNISQLPSLPWKFDLDSMQETQLLSGERVILGHKWTWSSNPMVWHEAPDTQRQWPQVFFNQVAYREGNIYGDVRIAWEPSRLQHLITLALYANHTEGKEQGQAVSLIEKQLLSWVAANPPLTGIHYLSVMECALRLIAVCHALDLVRHFLTQPKTVWPAVLTLVNSHATLIRKRISKHSSAGNHTIAEAVGLVYAGLLFPEYAKAKQWLTYGLSLLEQEAQHQIFPDGGGREQGMWYLRFVSDLYGLVVSLLHHYQQPVPPKLKQTFERSCAFLKTMMRPEIGTLPRIGDGDDGYALSPFLRFVPSQGKADLRLKVCQQSGYTLIHGQNNVRLLFDHGALGMSPCYAHGHADALSIVLDIGIQEVLIDPGTYSYTGYPEWRQYFRGTRAHNTVTVNQKDQAIQESAFLWSQPYDGSLVHREESSDGTITLLARHSGYVRRFGVTHWRGILYAPQGPWIIWDYLTGVGAHQLELNWHLAFDPIFENGMFASTINNDEFQLCVAGGDATAHRGETSPIKGWFSPHYGVKEPCTTLSVNYLGQLPHEFHTMFGLNPTRPLDRVDTSIIQIFKKLIHEANSG